MSPMIIKRKNIKKNFVSKNSNNRLKLIFLLMKKI